MLSTVIHKTGFQDANCPLITEMSCSVCTKPELTCTDPECCTDSDCEAGYVCQDQVSATPTVNCIPLKI